MRERNARLFLLTAHFSLLTLMGCRVSLSPLGNRLEVGSDAYVIFDALGEDGQGDLYAVPTSGGTIFPVTYSRAHEAGPVLSPDGTQLAFLRSSRAGDSLGYRVWIMNLINGAERQLPESDRGAPTMVRWSRDGQQLFVRTPGGDLVAVAPPASGELYPARGPQAAEADSAFQVLLGDPPFATVIGCPGSAGLCARDDSGSEQLLTQSGRAPFQWGPDSVGYFVGDEIEVRPLGGGVTRRLIWSRPPAAPSTATCFAGSTREASPPGMRM